MRAEPEYVISRKMGFRGAGGHDQRADYFYRVRRGSRKVCEVWADTGEVRKFYNAQGRLAYIPDIYKPPGTDGGRLAITTIMLRNAFDWTTAREWASSISPNIRMPMNTRDYQSGYAFSVVVYKKSELFAMILDARQARVAK